MSSSNTVKYPPLPIATMGFSDKQMTDYGLEMLRLNAPVAGLRLDGLLISRGSWDTVRAVQAALLHRGVKTETCDLAGATSPETSVTFYVDAPMPGVRYAVGGTATLSGAPYAGHNIVRNVDVPFSAETVTLHRKGRYPVQLSVQALADMVDGSNKSKPAEPEPFDLKRAQAGEPIQMRSGCPAKFVAFEADAAPHQQVIIKVNQRIQLRYADGRFMRDGRPGPGDLFMAPKPKRTVWVNTFSKPTGSGVVSLAFADEAKARAHAQAAPLGAWKSSVVPQEIE